jgi:hypothetical protein
MPADKTHVRRQIRFRRLHEVALGAARVREERPGLRGSRGFFHLFGDAAHGRAKDDHVGIANGVRDLHMAFVDRAKIACHFKSAKITPNAADAPSQAALFRRQSERTANETDADDGEILERQLHVVFIRPVRIPGEEAREMLVVNCAKD